MLVFGPFQAPDTGTFIKKHLFYPLTHPQDFPWAPPSCRVCVCVWADSPGAALGNTVSTRNCRSAAARSMVKDTATRVILGICGDCSQGRDPIQ